MTNVAREFIQKRPNTSLFIGLLLVGSCIPVAIFLAIVLGFFLVMFTGLLIIQGTIIGFGLTTLLVILPGPLCFATFCTLLAYIVQRLFAKVKPVCKRNLEDLMNRAQVLSSRIPISQSRKLSDSMAFMTRGNGQEDLNIDMNTDEEYEQTSSNNLLGQQTQDKLAPLKKLCPRGNLLGSRSRVLLPDARRSRHNRLSRFNNIVGHPSGSPARRRVLHDRGVYSSVSPR